MRIDVSRPHIADDTVVFSWTQSGPNPFQLQNTFSFRYRNIDLNRYTNDVFYEIFLALQLRVFAHYDEPVDVAFSEPISSYSVAFWQTYHQATRVSISPIADTGSYSPWKCGHLPQGLPSPRRYGVMFGGGKDSTLAVCLLSEIYGADQIVLFQMIHPYRAEPEEETRIEQRQESLMLRPMRERVGVATNHVSTDFITNQTREGRNLRPHLELYSVGFLPAMLHWGVSMLTTSYPWTAFPFRRLSKGQLWFRYPLTRPEFLATQTTHYSRTAGIDITLTNVNLLFTPLTAFRLLAERYRSILPQIVMCNFGGSSEHWCYQCRKCAEYALYGLACGIVDPRLDYNRMFSRSKFIKELIAHLECGVERTSYGNVPMNPIFGGIVMSLATCHMLAHVPIDLVAPYLGRTAFGNLLMLKAAYGNTVFPSIEQIPQSAIDLLGHDTAKQMAAIAANHFEVVDRLGGPFDVGGITVEYDFTVRMTSKTADLAHHQA